ncbi:MarR family winged helix-turn-helix transcriptional regulator [Cryobacterium arcticum]|uniref:MarR family transcriptional regulator n=1 Tax=Cryobacterium arcticum TaxID=670052 RepID=A0A317ZXR7_9MICO|nr:MarR family winged helix-turn-helix transcriptional regulator [Cryobacterium arcticum]PXA72119.1 MarR family transcriptional regulator [Cryobacterium arcticum]
MVRYTDVFTQLVRVEIELWNGLDAHLEATTGVSLATFQAMSAIRSSRGAARVQDISAELAITVGATSKLVDRLERDGLATRSAHPNDRRSSIVALSDRGATALAAADGAAEAHLRAVLGNALADDRAEDLLAELTALRAGARELSA